MVYRQADMKRLRKAFITHKGYGKNSKVVYYPLDEDICVQEPTTLRRLMKQIQVELLKPVEFCGMFGVKTYPKGVQQLDSDLAKLLVRLKSARYVLPHRPVPSSR